MERVTIIGRLTRDPEMRYFESGNAVTNLTVAVDRTAPKTNYDGSDKDCPAGWVESHNGRQWRTTVFWRVSVWGKAAEACNQYLKKGREVYVEGQVRGESSDGALNPRIWTDDSGEPHASFEIEVNRDGRVKFLGGSGGASNDDDDQEERRRRDKDEPPLF